jgi:hypothetical protein
VGLRLRSATNINLIKKTMITKVTFMAYDKQCEMLFTDKSNKEIHETLQEMCSTYELLDMETQTEWITADELPF